MAGEADEPAMVIHGGKCFSDPSSLKILSSNFLLFHILFTTNRPTNGEKHRAIVGSIFEKNSLENRKISNFAYSLAKFFLAIFNRKFN